MKRTIRYIGKLALMILTLWIIEIALAPSAANVESYGIKQYIFQSLLVLICIWVAMEMNED